MLEIDTGFSGGKLDAWCTEICCEHQLSSPCILVLQYIRNIIYIVKES